MKLILDEWIVREVIDTLYMARTTFLGITGLDSPQEVAKKSANETAITRRISQAIDIIQKSQQQPIPESLEEAAEEYVKKGRYLPEAFVVRPAFKAGAEWMAGQGYSQEVTVEDRCLEIGYGVLPGIDLIINLPDSFKPGEKVIVQVRKKEE